MAPIKPVSSLFLLSYNQVKICVETVCMTIGWRANNKDKRIAAVRSHFEVVPVKIKDKLVEDLLDFEFIERRWEIEKECKILCTLPILFNVWSHKLKLKYFHVYNYQGRLTQLVKCQVKNSLQHASNLTQLTDTFTCSDELVSFLK